MQQREHSLIDYTISFFMVLLILLVFVPIVSRQVFNNPVVWSDEMSRLVMIWLVYIGMSVCYKNREHIEVNIVFNLFPDKVKKILSLLTDIIWLTLAMLMIINGYKLTVTSWNHALPSSGLPEGLMSLALLVGSVILAAEVVISIIRFLKNWKSGNLTENKESDY